MPAPPGNPRADWLVLLVALIAQAILVAFLSGLLPGPFR